MGSDKSWIALLASVVVLTSVGCVTSGKYDALDAAYRQSQDELANANAKISTMSVEIGSLEGDLILEAGERVALQGSLSEKERALASLRAREAQAAARISQFQELTDKFRALVDAGKLKVSVIRGRMVVQMQTDVLFGSGSARLSAEGRAAIDEVSGLLASLAERRYQIEGHTDNVPIHTAAFPSNWELAAARAISVVSVMVDQGMAPERVSAVSYGETTPIAANDSKEGRAQNRRIEIVVVPDLSQLPGFEELERIADGA
jgi:chemotaxis protein MotB